MIWVPFFPFSVLFRRDRSKTQSIIVVSRSRVRAVDRHHCRRSQGLGRLTLHALANYYTPLRGTCFSRVHFSRKLFWVLPSPLLPSPTTPRQDAAAARQSPATQRSGSARLACVQLLPVASSFFSDVCLCPARPRPVLLAARPHTLAGFESVRRVPCAGMPMSSSSSNYLLTITTLPILLLPLSLTLSTSLPSSPPALPILPLLPRISHRPASLVPRSPASPLSRLLP